MISRNMKETFYRSMALPMRANGWMWRKFRAPSNGAIKVQLGPGQRNYLPGWVNVDANLFTAKIDIWADLRNPLPFRDGTVDCFYSHHVIEHFRDDALPAHFRDMYRCLKPGGVIRVGGPNSDNAVRKYLEGDLEWLGDFPDRRESAGGRLANFILCRGEHLTILTFSYLTEIASAAGFVNITQCRPIEDSQHRELFAPAMATEWETTPACPHTLLIEAEKPKS
jgi:predicted SAM-dependent methyltransferase